LPTYQVAEGVAVPAATASFSLRFTVPLLAAEHFFGCWPLGVELPATGGYVGTSRTRFKTFLFTESYLDIRMI